MRRSRSARLAAVGCLLGLTSAFLLPTVPAQADTVRAGQWYLGFLDVADAHRYSEGAGVTVGLVDTGVDGTHPDLTGSVLPGTALFPGATGDGQTDIDGHGTGMAGLIAGHGHGPNGQLGVLGIAPEATILPVRSGEAFFAVGTVSAIQWATSHGAKVISISFSDSTSDDRERQAVEDAIAHDVVVVAAVANTPDRSPQYPAAYPGVVGVAGVDENGNHGSFSVGGPDVMLSAPGADIITTDLSHGYSNSTGTSDSTAIVAGTVALVRSRFPKLSAADVIHRLTATAIDKGPPGRDDLYGYGIVNLVGALTADVPPLAASRSASSSGSLSISPRAGRRSGSVGWTWLIIGLGALVGAIVLAAALSTRHRRPG